MPGKPSGLFRHTILLQRPVEVQDPNTGAVDLVWQDYGTRSAQSTPQRIKELIAAAAVHSEIRGVFIVRYDPAITADMRVIYRGKQHAILGVMEDPDSGLEYMTLAVSEGVLADV